MKTTLTKDEIRAMDCICYSHCYTPIEFEQIAKRRIKIDLDDKIINRSQADEALKELSEYMEIRTGEKWNNENYYESLKEILEVK